MAASPSCTLVARWRAMDRPTSRSTDGHRRIAPSATSRPPYSFTSPRRQVSALPGKVRALSRFPLSNNGGDGSDGRGSQQQQKEQQERQRKAEADLQGAIDEVEGFWNMPVIPWSEFFSKLTPPPSSDKWMQRLRLNGNYYRGNYTVICSAVTLAISMCVDPYIWLGYTIGILSYMIKSAYWVSQISPFLRKFFGKSITIMYDMDGSSTLMVTQPNNKRKRGNDVLSVGEEQLVTTQDPKVVSLFLSMWGSYLLISTPLRSLMVLAMATAIGGTLTFIHASLRQPGFKSSVAGLFTANSRDEMSQNLRALWDLAQGKGEKN